MIILISAGHGGDELGAVGNGLIEKNMNLEVALLLEEKLKQYDCEVIMARRDDSEMSLNSRVLKQKITNSNVVVDIHHNAFDGKKSGYEIYHSIVGGEGKDLAYAIGKEFSKVQKKKYIGPRESDIYKGKDFYFIIKHTSCPAIITEFCYIDSPDYKNFDADLEATLLCNGIVDFYKLERLEEEYDEFEEVEVPTLDEYLEFKEKTERRLKRIESLLDGKRNIR